MSDLTLYERVTRWFHNRPVVVAALVCTAVVAAIATFVTSTAVIRSSVAGLSLEVLRVADQPEEVAAYASWMPVDTGSAYVRTDAVRQRYPTELPSQRWLDSAMNLSRKHDADTAQIAALMDSMQAHLVASPLDYPSEAVIRGVGLEPIVDVTLRNSDARPALITALDYSAVLRQGSKSTSQCVGSGPMPVSNQYHVLLRHGRTQTGRIEMSHEVSANSLDRLAIKIATDANFEEAIYRIRARLTYNGKRALLLPPFDVRLTWTCMKKHEKGLKRPFRLPPVE